MRAQRPGAGPDGEAGSVLVEALVGLAIVATILAAADRIAVDSTARHSRVEARRYALMVARSALEMVGSAVPLQAGATEGEDGADVWRVDMQPCGAEPSSSAGVLYCIAVSVRGAEGGPPLVTLNSRRLGPRA